MSWRTKLDEGRPLARRRPPSARLRRSGDAVSRHEPALHHLGLTAHGDESAPVPHGSQVSEPYRWTSPPPPPPRRPAGRPEMSADGRALRGGPRRGSTLGWLATLCAAATLAFLVALLSAGGGSVRTSTSRRTAPAAPATSPARIAPAPSPATAAPAASSATRSPGPAPSTGPAPTSSSPAPAPAPAAPAPPGGGPVIAAMSPSSGPAGTAVTLTGRGLYSSSGSIVVLFGSVQAPVSCPTQQACVATAPPQATSAPGPGAAPAPPAVPVTVTTDSGRSAPVVFTYTG